MKKFVLINGSPRKKGNTAVLVQTVSAALLTELPQAHVEVIETAHRGLKPCLHCDVCQKNGGICIQNDGVNELLEIIAKADALVFATPVYWWGITAQIKTFLDRFYAKGGLFAEKRKKIGLIVTGAAETTDRQYDLIKGQFECICEYLNWEFAFYQPVCASNAGEIASNVTVLAHTAAQAKQLL